MGFFESSLAFNFFEFIEKDVIIRRRKIRPIPSKVGSIQCTGSWKILE